MAERWMYQILADKGDYKGKWVTVGEEGKPFETIVKAQEYSQKATRRYNFCLGVDVECERLLKTKGVRAKETCCAEKVITEFFSQGVMRWRVEMEDETVGLGRYYDVAWEDAWRKGRYLTEEELASREAENRRARELPTEENAEWQIRVGDKWQDARFMNPCKIEDENTVIGYLIANGIKRDQVSIYPTRLREVAVRGGGKAAGYFMNPEETREMVEKGMRKGLVRRKIAESPEDVLKQLKLDATYHDLLRRSVEFALSSSKISPDSERPLPYLEINEEQVKFAGKIYDRETLADLLKGTTREIPWHETKYHEGPRTLEQRIIVDFKKMIEDSYGSTVNPNKVLRNMRFMTIKELQRVKEEIGTLSFYLVEGAVKRGVREIPIAGTVYSLAEADDAFETVDTIAQAVTEEAVESAMPPYFKRILLGLKLGFDVWGLINAFRYLSKLNKDLDEELSNRKGKGEDEAMQFFRMAAGREVELATMAWRAYKELTESRVANVTIGLDQSVRKDLQGYYDKYFVKAGDEPYWAVMKINQILREDLGREPLKRFPTEEADIPSYFSEGYSLKQDVFMNLLPGVVETAEYLYHEEFVPGQGVPCAPQAPPLEYYEWWEDKPHVPGERYRGPKLSPLEGNEQTYFAPSDGTQFAVASLATTGGDGVAASPVGGALSFSVPSVPSVGLPGLGGVASTPRVGFGGTPSRGATPVPQMPPVGLTSFGTSGGGSGVGLGAYLLAPFKELAALSKKEHITPMPRRNRIGKFTERLFQVPQMMLTASPLGSLFAAGGTAGNLLGGLSEPQPQPQIVYRFEQGSVQIHTQKISPERLGSVFIDFLRQYSQAQ